MDREKLTPMMKQYWQVKDLHRDKILFYRLGDFYEMFFDDAVLASRLLNIVLTSRDCGLDSKAPMCGVPFHSASNYIKKLVDLGYKVAICEQVEDSDIAKGLVRREVVRVITASTIIEDELLDTDESRILLVILEVGKILKVFHADVSTSSLGIDPKPYSIDLDSIYSIIAKNNIREIIYVYEEDSEINDAITSLDSIENISFSSIRYSLGNDVDTLDVVNQVIRQVTFLEEFSFRNVGEISNDKYLMIGTVTKRNLDIVKNSFTGTSSNTLIELLNKCQTSSGRRLLHDWIDKPLTNISEIEFRLDKVGFFISNLDLSRKISHELKGLNDVERIVSRLNCNRAKPSDIIKLKSSLSKSLSVYRLLRDNVKDYNWKLDDTLKDLNDLRDELDRFIDDQNLDIFVKKGYSHELDILIDGKELSSNRLIDYENLLKEETKIKNLKISYNKVFGYFIEVSKSNVPLVPQYFIRKQTLVNAERYITEHLKELEDIALSSDERLSRLQNELLGNLVSKVNSRIEDIIRLMKDIAFFDVLISFAFSALENNYVKPIRSDDGTVNIIEGRHPVLEKSLTDDVFVPNDIRIENKNFHLITGPNMAGKSTYMRQYALIVIMYQIGSYVPASYAKMVLYDKLFARIGAADDIASGRSTFMVEMGELSYILENATRKSLIILDEVGRGTSTYDGISIAHASIDYIVKRIGCDTFFATHYHELIALDKDYNSLVNLSMDVVESNGKVVFMKKIRQGGTDKSYGLHVAKLAGLPESLLLCASRVMKSMDFAPVFRSPSKQVSFFDVKKQSDIIINRIKEIDISITTPIEALNMLNLLKTLVEESDE